MSVSETPNVSEILDDTIGTWRKERPDIDFEGMALFLKMSAVVQSIIERFRSDIVELGITLSEFDVLATLRRNGPKAVLTPSHIARVAMVKPSGLAHRLTQLENAGLISRSPDPADRRSALLRITPNGRRVVDRAIEILADHKNMAFSDLTERQRESLEQLLDKLIDAADNLRESIPTSR